ncbi:MAG: hypothetical protein M9962_13520 [Oligoflexia bacterium]|nr:hypothetical protein [Oligoflexia bacterium]
MLKNLLNQRRLLASLSVLSASASTVIYLLMFYSRDDSTNFTHLYSTVMIFSGWLNTFAFFGGLKGKVKKWSEAIIYFLLISVCTIFFRKFLFNGATSYQEALFIFGCASLTFMTPFLRSLFELGLFKVAYSRIITINSFLFIVALLSLILNSRAFLEVSTSLAIFIAIYFNFSLVEKSEDVSIEGDCIKILNPNTLIVERVLFDQKYLIVQGVAEQTLLYYFLSRFISFIGTIAFSLGIESLLSKRREKVPSYGYLLVLPAVVIVYFLREQLGVLTYLLIGQAQLWLIVKCMTVFSSDQKRYLRVYAICLVDMIYRWFILIHQNASAVYLLLSIVVLSIVCFIEDISSNKSSQEV